MTYKISMEITTQQIEEMIEQLPKRDKIALSKKLGMANAQQKIHAILKSIDSRKARRPSTSEILQEIRDYRKAQNARRH